MIPMGGVGAFDSGEGIYVHMRREHGGIGG